MADTLNHERFAIEATQGDITLEQVDVIVNAANETLLGGGGVDGAIHRAAGPDLLEACRALGGCAPGDAKMTDGYNLPAASIIHTVGPRWLGGRHNEAGLLSACYRRCLALADTAELSSIAFPAISTGAFGFPLQAATQIAVETVQAYRANSIKRVRFVCFDEQTLRGYLAVLETQSG